MAKLLLFHCRHRAHKTLPFHTCSPMHFCRSVKVYKFWLGCLVKRNNNTDKWAARQCPCWRPYLQQLFRVEHPHRTESFKLHVRGVRIDTCARNRLKTWHKVLVWNKAESFDSEAGNIVWEPLSWSSTGKISNSSKVSGVTSKITSVEQK